MQHTSIQYYVYVFGKSIGIRKISFEVDEGVIIPRSN